MGILNVTPDSFSDGGLFVSPDRALARARTMVDEGADIIDVGGESTRPGATTVSVQEELDRVIPVIEALADAFNVPISIDTSKPEVMRTAVNAGAGFINDINSLRADQALKTVAQLGVPVCLMHMQGQPRSMQQAPHYDDVVEEVCVFLGKRRDAAVAAGINPGHIIFDPGFGFGKSLDHNRQLLRGLSRFTALGPPLMVGLSRKSMIGKVLDAKVDQRLYGSLALMMVAIQNGASLVRVHDVKVSRDVIRMLEWVGG
ncbi:MAG TPA: dihydropteroate synthase [Acidiferrobacteraceae bacterium]|nr:dihydropteroate synthase [Acidiferrobacteraceae bacterium]